MARIRLIYRSTNEWEFHLPLPNTNISFWVRVPKVCDCEQDDKKRVYDINGVKTYVCACDRLFPCKRVKIQKGKFDVSLELVMQLLGGARINARVTEDELRTQLQSVASRSHTINLDRGLVSRDALVANSVEYAVLLCMDRVKILHQNFLNSGSSFSH